MWTRGKDGEFVLHLDDVPAYIERLQEKLDWCLTELEQRGLPDIPGTTVRVFHNPERSKLLAAIRKEYLEDCGFERKEEVSLPEITTDRTELPD